MTATVFKAYIQQLQAYTLIHVVGSKIRHIHMKREIKGMAILVKLLLLV